MAICPNCHTPDKEFFALKCHECNTPVGLGEQIMVSLVWTLTMWGIVLGVLYFSFRAIVG